MTVGGRERVCTRGEGDALANFCRAEDVAADHRWQVTAAWRFGFSRERSPAVPLEVGVLVGAVGECSCRTNSASTRQTASPAVRPRTLSAV
jgi:hypothetical protein